MQESTLCKLLEQLLALPKESEWLEFKQEHRHNTLDEQREALNKKLRGHYEYYGRPTDHKSLWRFYRVRRIWKENLNRRTRGRTVTWEKFGHIEARYSLEPPRITKAWVR